MTFSINKKVLIEEVNTKKYPGLNKEQRSAAAKEIKENLSKRNLYRNKATNNDKSSGDYYLKANDYNNEAKIVGRIRNLQHANNLSSDQGTARDIVVQDILKHNKIKPYSTITNHIRHNLSQTVLDSSFGEINLKTNANKFNELAQNKKLQLPKHDPYQKVNAKHENAKEYVAGAASLAALPVAAFPGTAAVLGTVMLSKKYDPYEDRQSTKDFEQSVKVAEEKAKAESQSLKNDEIVKNKDSQPVQQTQPSSTIEPSSAIEPSSVDEEGIDPKLLLGGGAALVGGAALAKHLYDRSRIK